MVCVIWQVRFRMSSIRAKCWDDTCIYVISEYVVCAEKLGCFFAVQYAAVYACDAFTAGLSH